ncbi:MAG: hypothetical protein IJ727_02475 [Treponema sp.]|nr:hypothetical protein [Treponema sp.]
MKSKLFFLISLFIISSSSLFAKTLILERSVKNEVTGYNKKVYREKGKVSLYVNEFTSDKDGSKLGFAYAIKSDSAESPVLYAANEDFNSEREGGWLIYYEKGDSFYIGSIWKNGYKTTVTDRSCFYEFDKNIGYDIYFMFCYLRAVNRNLTFENKILYTDNDHFWWDDNITAFAIRLSEFSDYAKYSKSQGNNPPYPSFKICLFHDSHTTGRKIAENLKKGMWKTKSRNAGRPGSGLPQYGEITCWYKEDDLCDSIEEFCRHDPERLKLVIDFAPVAVK